jgi:hypothetical protein
LLLAFAALLVAAPLVRCQDDDDDVEDTFVDAEETVASPAPAAAGSAGGIADVATEYLNTATELGKQYASQAAEVAQQYLGSYGVSTCSSGSHWQCRLHHLGVAQQQPAFHVAPMRAPYQGCAAFQHMCF